MKNVFPLDASYLGKFFQQENHLQRHKLINQNQINE